MAAHCLSSMCDLEAASGQVMGKEELEIQALIFGLLSKSCMIKKTGFDCTGMVPFSKSDPERRHFLLLIICATSDGFLPAEEDGTHSPVCNAWRLPHPGTRQFSGSMAPLCGSGLLCGGHCTLACCARARAMGCITHIPCLQVCTRIWCTLPSFTPCTPK